MTVFLGKWCAPVPFSANTRIEYLTGFKAFLRFENLIRQGVNV